jgi:hypothetical protein
MFCEDSVFISVSKLTFLVFLRVDTCFRLKIIRDIALVTRLNGLNGH